MDINQTEITVSYCGETATEVITLVGGLWQWAQYRGEIDLIALAIARELAPNQEIDDDLLGWEWAK